MTKYLLSVHVGADDVPAQMSEEEMRAGQARVARLEEEMHTAGALVLSGRLEGPSRASVVRASDGKVITTDGPFVEAKEIIGGFYVVDAADDDAARNWAARTSAAINMPIEVRPFFALVAPGDS